MEVNYGLSQVVPQHSYMSLITFSLVGHELPFYGPVPQPEFQSETQTLRSSESMLSCNNNVLSAPSVQTLTLCSPMLMTATLSGIASAFLSMVMTSGTVHTLF